MTDPIDDCHGKKKCPWNDRKSDRWVQAVDAAAWKARGGGEWVKRLDCPRCGDPMGVRYGSGTVATIVEEIEEIHGNAPGFGERVTELRIGEDVDGEASGRSTGDTSDTTPARCNCTHKHEGQPAHDNAGCGQWGVIRAPEGA